MAGIGRRALIAGASVIGLGAAAGIVFHRSRGDGAASEVTRLIEAVGEDYRSGRVAVVGGWILSQSEVEYFDLPINGQPSS